MLWLWSCSDSLVAFGSVCLTQKVVWDDESICGYAHFCRWRKTGKGRKNLTWATKMTTRGNLAASLARAAPCTRARVYSVRWTSSLISETLIQSFCDCYNAQFLCATHCYPTSLFATCIPKFHRQSLLFSDLQSLPFSLKQVQMVSGWCTNPVQTDTSQGTRPHKCQELKASIRNKTYQTQRQGRASNDSGYLFMYVYVNLATK